MTRKIVKRYTKTTVLFNDYQILRLDFFKGLRESAILWLIGTYVELIENEVVLRENKLDIDSVKGFFKQRKASSRHLAIPDLGRIPGIDWDDVGVG